MIKPADESVGRCGVCRRVDQDEPERSDLDAHSWSAESWFQVFVVSRGILLAGHL